MTDVVTAESRDRLRLLTQREVLRSPASMARALDPLYQIAPHVELLDRHLVALCRGDIDRLMVVEPPRHGKSELTTGRTPAWFLRQHPERRVVAAGYGDEFIRDFGRASRDLITQNKTYFGLSVRSDTKAANRWNLVGHKGGMYTVGVGGQLTGRGANLLIVDDPVKDWEEANSAVYRERIWNWWTSTARTRLQGRRSAAIVIQTRWHHDDLAGRLLATQRHRWVVLHLRAVAIADETLASVTNADPDVLVRWKGDGPAAWERKAGEALWPQGPDGYDTEWMAQTREEVGPYVWEALYQGNPTPAEGGLFRGSDFRYWYRRQSVEGELWDVGGTMVRRRDCWLFATVDLAASTRTGADFTVMAVWAVTPAGDLLLVDRYRGRIGEDAHWGAMQALHARWRFAFAGVEKGFIGSTLVYEAGRAGLPFRALSADKDKVTRALPATARLAAGRVWWPDPTTHPWVRTEWEPELLAFDKGTHDDQVDTLSYAVAQTAHVGARRLSSGGFAADDRSSEARISRHIASLDRKHRRARHHELGRW